MPGKTRHLQTYNIKQEQDTLTVCDCPGLVFPSIKKSSRAGLILAGVLSLHQMRDYISPIDSMIQKIPYNIFNFMYKLNIKDKNVKGRQLLEMFADNRGYYSGGGSGTYDLNRASRQLLGDYLGGKLIFVELPPNYDNSDNHINQSNQHFQEQWAQMAAIQEQDEIDQQEIKKESEIQKCKDGEFFETQTREEIVDQLMETLDDDDLVELMEGKKVKGVKLDKNLRREIKHMIKRNEDISVAEILSRDGVIVNNQKIHA